ncbi:MAG: hypothetical protein HY303_12150 [Candidatus Wallbacteria bacterium]|nr:hypothetical protein [Candidatus Wallbacteria bacterium]
MSSKIFLTVVAVALVSASLAFAADGPAAVASSDAARDKCFKVQRLIGRAYQAYCQEAKSPRRDIGTFAFFSALVKNGFLDQMPTDPGFEGDSYAHFRHRRSGNGITCYHHGDPDSGGRSERERCFAIQKELSDAIDSFGRERGVPAGRDIGTRKFFEQLVAGGHIEAIPQDPGQGKDSFKDFRQSASGHGLECAVHGPAIRTAGSEREQCWRLQATMAQALDQYSLEKSVHRTDVGNRAFFSLLVREGYLHDLPLDPGQPGDSFGNFRYTEDGNHVECAVHGRSPGLTGAQTSQPTSEE